MDFHGDMEYSNEKFNKSSIDVVLQIFLNLVNIFEIQISLQVKYYCIACGINYETIYQIGAKFKNAAEENTSMKIIKCFCYIPMIDLFDKALQRRRLSFHIHIP